MKTPPYIVGVQSSSILRFFALLLAKTGILDIIYTPKYVINRIKISNPILRKSKTDNARQAVPTLQSLTGPVQGQNRVFPVQYFHTGKNLFSIQGSLLEILHRENPVFITGTGLQCRNRVYDACCSAQYVPKTSLNQLSRVDERH